ncbi:MAG: ankyrin repeat domain-containing protein [Candidatus Zixiibacteriota bacterium]
MYTRVVSAVLICCLFCLCNLPAFSADILTAARNGDLQTVKQLISHDKTIVNFKDDRGTTALHLACDSGRTEVAKYLIQNGADLLAVDNDGDTPLHYAAFSGYPDCIRLLVEKGTPVDVLNTNKSTPLHYAAMRGKPEAAAVLLDLGADINRQNYDGETPVFIAAAIKNADMIKLLVERGADLEVANNYGRTPLLNTAREGGDIPIARLLLDLGANVNARDRGDETAIGLATWRGFRELADLLLDRGAEFDHTGREGEFLLAYSAEKKIDRLFNLLVERGADLSILNERGGTLLHSAALSGSVPIIKTLLSRKFDVNKTDNYNHTPLHYAAEKGRIEAAQVLIENGADLKARTLSGLSAYNLAEKFNRAEMQKLLWAKGSCKIPQKFPALTDKYMGQKPPGDQPVPFALDIVSTTEGEHGCITFSPDYTQAFWSANYMLNESGYGTGNMLWSRFVDGQWTIPEFPPFCPDFDLRGDVPMFTPDGQRLYFISRRPTLPGGPEGKENIWYVSKRGDGWSDPIPLGPSVNSMDTHWQFSLDNEYNLYFTTSDENSLGMADIYFAEYKDGRYLTPVHMGDVLNSEVSEGTPYVSPDVSFMIFSRHGYKDRSQNGLYLSYHTPDGGWTEPVFLNKELGIPRMGLCPIVSPDGQYLFMIGYTTGQSNIHWMRADFIDRLRPKS